MKFAQLLCFDQPAATHRAPVLCCPAGELLVGPDLMYDSFDEEAFEVSHTACPLQFRERLFRNFPNLQQTKQPHHCVPKTATIRFTTVTSRLCC